MRRKGSLRSWLPWLLCALCVSSGLLHAVQWAAGLDGWPSLYDSLDALGLALVVPVLFSVFGALILSRQPRNVVGWLLMVTALAGGILIPLAQVTIPRLYPMPSDAGPGWLLYAWVVGWLWIPVIIPILLIPLHFPTGAPPSPRWRVADYLALAMVSVYMLLTAVGVRIDGAGASLPNPIGFVPNEVLDTVLGPPWYLALLTLLALSVSSLFVRYRHANAEGRLQIKWLLYACVLFALDYAFTAVMGDTASAALEGWTYLFLLLTVAAMGAAIAIAILRYRLYDIDVIVRKTAVYSVLTALLALVYFGTVLLLQNLFGVVAGEQSPGIIVVSTLLIAALFAPLRRRVQDIIDRRFFRRKVDAQQVLAQFAQTARDETDKGALTAELTRVVQETLQPQGVTLWLSPAAREEYHENRR